MMPSYYKAQNNYYSCTRNNTIKIHISNTIVVCPMLYVVVCFLIFMPSQRRVEGHINLPLFVRPDIDAWFVRLSPPTVLELQL